MPDTSTPDTQGIIDHLACLNDIASGHEKFGATEHPNDATLEQLEAKQAQREQAQGQGQGRGEGSGYSEVKEHPYLKELNSAYFSGFDENLNPLPGENPEAEENYKQQQLRKQLQKQMEKGEYLGSTPRFTRTR